MTTIHEVVRVPFISVDRDGEMQKVPLFRAPAPRYVAFMKGAVDSMLDVSTTTRVQNNVRSLEDTEAHPVFNPDGTRSFRERILKQDAETAERGLRDLGFGIKCLDELPVKSDVAHVEHDFTFLGRIAM